MNAASKYAFLKRKKAPTKVNFQEPTSALENDQPDTNVISVKFDSLKHAEENIQMGDAAFCKECKACLSSISKLYTKQQYQALLKQFNDDDKEEEKKEEKKKLEKIVAPPKIDQSKVIATPTADELIWICEFCGTHNPVHLDQEELPHSDDVIYLLKSAQQMNKNPSDLSSDISTIFCIDNSGSMSVTHEIQGKHDFKHGLSEEEYEMLKGFIEQGADQYLPNQKKDTTFITRKQCVLAAIEAQLLEMKAEYPNRKVGLVTFDNEVTVIGDGKNIPEVIAGDKLYKEDVLKQIGVDAGKKLVCASVKESAEKLIEKFTKLNESGKTALGPGLIISLGLALQGKQGSKVILCTDGLANIGLGEMDTPEGLAKAEEFYTELATFAKENGIVVSVISIKGEGCKLDVLGKLASLTSGSLIRVDPNEITDKFANIMKQEVLGTQVEMKLRLHQGMKFRNEAEEFLKEKASLFEKNVGNVTAKTEMTFEYEMRNDEELGQLGIDANKLDSVPFQAQITYISTNGDRLMRVITQALKATDNLEEAEKNLKVNILAARALQQQAQLAAKGLYVASNQVGGVWEDYIDRRISNKVSINDRTSKRVIEDYSKRKTEMATVSHKRSERDNIKESFPLSKEEEEEEDAGYALFHDNENCNSEF